MLGIKKKGSELEPYFEKVVATKAEGNNGVLPTSEPAVEKVLVFEQRKKKKGAKLAKKIILIATATAILALGGFSLYQLFAPKPVVEQTTAVMRGSISSVVEGAGVAMPKASSDITTVAEGKVLEVLVAEGDQVNEGDLLFRVDDSKVRKNITDAEDNLRKTQKSLTSAQDNLRETEKSSAKIQEYIDHLTLKANATGQLQGLKVKKGDMIAEGTEIGMIVNTGKLRLTQYYSYAYEGKIKKGQSVNISIPSTMSNVTGTVTDIEYVKKVTAEGGVLFEVTIELNNPGALTEGMSATGAISLDNGAKAMPAENGSLEFANKTVLKSKSGGEVKELSVKNFYEVKEGQILLKLENDDYEKQLTQKQDSIDAARESVKSAESALETANEAVNKAYEVLDNYIVKAPISGTVTQCSLKEGDELKGSATIAMNVSDLSLFTVSMQIDELDIAKLSVGMPANITMDTYENGSKFFSGTISSLSMVGKNENGVSFFPGTIEISESEGLRSGYSVNYSVTTAQADDVLLVPASAVQYTEQGAIVFVKDNGQAKPENIVELDPAIQKKGFFAVAVVPGQTGNSQIEIVEGLNEGDEVATGAEAGGDMFGGGMGGGMGGKGEVMVG